MVADACHRHIGVFYNAFLPAARAVATCCAVLTAALHSYRYHRIHAERANAIFSTARLYMRLAYCALAGAKYLAARFCLTITTLPLHSPIIFYRAVTWRGRKWRETSTLCQRSNDVTCWFRIHHIDLSRAGTVSGQRRRRRDVRLVARHFASLPRACHLLRNAHHWA